MHNLWIIIKQVSAFDAEAKLEILFIIKIEAKTPSNNRGDEQSTTPHTNSQQHFYGSCDIQQNYPKTKTIINGYALLFRLDKVEKGNLHELWFPGLENLDKYVTKHQ